MKVLGGLQEAYNRNRLGIESTTVYFVENKGESDFKNPFLSLENQQWFTPKWRGLSALKGDKH